MAIKSTAEFDTKAKLFVGDSMHAKFLLLGIDINHVKKIRIKIKQELGKVSSETFKVKFLEICGKLISTLENIKVYSKRHIRKLISEMFSVKQKNI